MYDRTSNGHLGIIEFPVLILKGIVDVIKAIREKLYEPEFSELTVVDHLHGQAGIINLENREIR